MARYEFSEGTSNKFWEIKLSGKSFTTTYGKIGTAGSTTMKEFGSPAEAKKEHDKLVAEKVKKGYEPADGASAADADEDEDEAAPPPPKAAPKKAAPAPAAKAAAPAPKAAAKGATKPRYFEFSEGTSNKFWEIVQDGNNVKTRYGKIGAAGAQTLKEFGDAGAAKKEYDKLVAEKTKKGYEETEPS
jgi:predicted DNA-binding WGR domain protein